MPGKERGSVGAEVSRLLPSADYRIKHETTTLSTTVQDVYKYQFSFSLIIH